MSVADTMKYIMKEGGHTHAWTIDRMNAINNNIHMTQSKFSATINNKRRLLGDELIAFCQATKINPDVFMNKKPPD